MPYLEAYGLVGEDALYQVESTRGSGKATILLRGAEAQLRVVLGEAQVDVKSEA